MSVPDDERLAAERARGRSLLAVVGVAFALLVVVPLLAFGLPSVVVREEVPPLRGAERAAAEEALDLVWVYCHDNPLDRGLTLAHRVVSVRPREAVPDETLPDDGPLDEGGWGEPGPRTPLAGYVVDIQAYTVFAVPARRLRVSEDGARCDV
jgi:hypothetical protein